MHCVITAGPTYERLDDVRRLTNFSTGRLGCELAGYLTKRGHAVTLLIGEQATWRGERSASRVEEFSTTDDLHERLRQLAGGPVDAVFHAAAVSDFTFGQAWERQPSGELAPAKAGKISTRSGTLLVELLPTKKIILQLRDCYPRACLVGWKYEVDGTRTDALARGERQLRECRTDACVVNGRAYGEGFGLLNAQGECRDLPGKPDLFDALEELAARGSR